ncbi:MAG: RidA family protein [Planctomycetia bacterium]|nr:RidA family protein [Planctomycetia bacterium]
MKRKLISNNTPIENKVGFSRAVRVGSYISIGGTAPLDKNGKTVGIGDSAVQARQCYEIIKDVLERAGSGLHDVVRSRILLTDIDDWETVIEVRAEYLKDVKPVETIMQVSRFINPEWLVEIEVDAVVND